MATFPLNKCPTEILSEIAGQLTSIRDIRSLTLVNRLFNYAATSSLYQLAVHIPNNGWHDHCPAALLIEHNNVPILTQFLLYGLKPTTYIEKYLFLDPRFQYRTAGFTFLHLSLLCASDVAVLELLLQHGANVNARDWEGRTLLHWASGYANVLPQCMILLLDKGADINALDEKGRTPLLTAVERNSYEAVELLLKRGADMEVVDQPDQDGDGGWKALDYA
jgi:hypothetical protein